MNSNDRLAHIAQEVIRLQKRIIELHSEHNALIPIGTLPNEILAHIFFDYASVTSALFSMKWIAVSLVCRQWYEVAHGTPSLWSYLDYRDCFNPLGPRAPPFRRIAIQRERSKHIALGLRVVATENYPWQDALSLMDPTRIREFHVSGYPSFLDSIPVASYPALEHLEIHARGYNQDNDDQGQRHILPCLVAAPSLRFISLHGFSLDLKSITARGLRHLSAWASTHSITDVLTTLQYLPSLEVLDISLGEAEFEDEEAFMRRITPHAIRKVSILGPPSACIQFLFVVKLPPEASLSVYPQGLYTGPDASPLLVPVRKHVRRPAAPRIRRIDIRCIGQAFPIYFSAETDAATSVHDEAYFQLCSHPAIERERRRILTKTFHALPVQSVTHLYMCDLGTKTTWRTILGSLPALEYVSLRLESAALIGLCEALVESVGPHQAETRPRLRHLRVDACGVLEEESEQPGITTRAQRGMERLVDLLTILLDRLGAPPLDILELVEARVLLPATVLGQDPILGLTTLVGEKLLLDRRGYTSSRLDDL